MQPWLSGPFTDFELVIIDDGSTDGARELCEEFAKQDPLLRLIVQRNGGAAAARNMGILNAKGEYLTFVDSDDCLDADYLQVLYDAMVENEADMSMVNYRLFEPTERGVKFVNYITADDVETMVLDPR